MYSFDQQNFIVFEEGRSEEEKSVVLVRNGKYIGFGYLDSNQETINNELLIDCVKSYPDNREVQQIIRSYIRKKKIKLLHL